MQANPNMSLDSSTGQGRDPAFNWSVLLRALAPPLVVWLAMAGAVILSGQPGVVCVTPMAWLLATWVGLRYIQLSGGRPGRHPLLGAALLGALLGVGEGIFFVAVTAMLAPPSTPEDAAKTLILDLVVFGLGMLVCAGLSAFTALLTLKRYAREQMG